MRTRGRVCRTISPPIPSTSSTRDFHATRPTSTFSVTDFASFWKGEFGDGDICWDMSTRQWSWRILPGAESLAPQPSQLASAVASTKKSLLANFAQPRWQSLGRQKDQKNAQDHERRRL